MAFPSPPWRLRARAWLSLFAVRERGATQRPGGVHAVAFVDYVEGSVLTYHELLVGRLVRDGRTPRVRITDIWVDSAESRDGGRSLWAIPKQLADLPLHVADRGPVARASFRGAVEGQPIASAEFSAVPGAARLPVPVRAATSQLREDGSEVVTPFGGRTWPVPCHGRWSFDGDGPLGWLGGRRPLGSVHLRDADLTFGG
jgi:acetoacetate decarboxylase